MDSELALATPTWVVNELQSGRRVPIRRVGRLIGYQVTPEDMERLCQLEAFLRTSDDIYRPDRGACMECGVDRFKSHLHYGLKREVPRATLGCSMCEAWAALKRLPA